jgi:hypothetical protein
MLDSETNPASSATLSIDIPIQDAIIKDLKRPDTNVLCINETFIFVVFRFLAPKRGHSQILFE